VGRNDWKLIPTRPIFTWGELGRVGLQVRRVG